MKNSLWYELWCLTFGYPYLHFYFCNAWREHPLLLLSLDVQGQKTHAHTRERSATARPETKEREKKTL
jgi:hypothetical protein